LSSFYPSTFEEVATVVYDLICGVFELKSEAKELIYYHAYANVANRLCEVLYEGSFQV
jgi:hypothetical protein